MLLIEVLHITVDDEKSVEKNKTRSNFQNQIPVHSKDNEHTKKKKMKIIRNSQSKMKLFFLIFWTRSLILYILAAPSFVFHSLLIIIIYRANAIQNHNHIFIRHFDFKTNRQRIIFYMRINMKNTINSTEKKIEMICYSVERHFADARSFFFFRRIENCSTNYYAKWKKKSFYFQIIDWNDEIFPVSQRAKRFTMPTPQLFF